MTLPPEIAALLDDKARKRWTGKIVINMKEGRIISGETSESFRIESERSGQPAPYSNR